jgi:hypothetical protein
MATFSKEELAKIRDKEQANRDRAIAASAVHDAAVMDSIKSRLGMGQAPQQAPAPAPAPAQAPQMKKGGKVMEFKHKIEHEKKHAAGHQHEQEKVSKHKAGHKMHHEHVKAMSKGGKYC